MKHTLAPRQYAILLAVMCTASVGDTLLKRGMSQVGAVDLHHLGLLIRAIGNLNIVAGIALLIGFFGVLYGCAVVGGSHVCDAGYGVRQRDDCAAQPVLATRTDLRLPLVRDTVANVRGWLCGRRPLADGTYTGL